MTNNIKCVKGDNVSFAVYHEVDGNQYSLGENEFYRVKIKKNLGAGEPDVQADSDSCQFEFSHCLDCGKYYFEISLVSGGVETVISPATDTDGARLNTLCVTERL